MKKFKVKVEAEITIQFDENSPMFKELWHDYKENIDPNADYKDFTENIASIISRYGLQEMIEGVGYVKLNGKNQTVYHNMAYTEMDSCIDVQADTDINCCIQFDCSAEDISEK